MCRDYEDNGALRTLPQPPDIPTQINVDPCIFLAESIHLGDMNLPRRSGNYWVTARFIAQFFLVHQSPVQNMLSDCPKRLKIWGCDCKARYLVYLNLATRTKQAKSCQRLCPGDSPSTS